MTVTTNVYGYVEDEYLEESYLTSHATGAAGMQTRFVIQDQKPQGMQAEFQIIDYQSPFGMQVEFRIENFLKTTGAQALFVINDDKPIGMQVLAQILETLAPQGMQAELQIVDYLKPTASQSILVIETQRAVGMQVEFQIVDYVKALAAQAELVIFTDTPRGMEVRADKYPNSVCPGDGGYLEAPYLENPYLTPIWCLRPGMQALFEIKDFDNSNGMQAELQIRDYLKSQGMQVVFEIRDYMKSMGMQVDTISISSSAMQALATIYNADNLRILCEFPSRGLNNSNWTATSTATGDFSVQNLDTDIVEQVWRSAPGDVTGVRLVTDTGLPQGVFLDTLAILNHNMTRSANVTLLGSNDPTFTLIGVSIPLQARANNMFYIAPALPQAGYRYWRIDIDDVTNAAGYIEVGTIVFGASKIFQGECFVDEVDFQLTDFADTVRTEGFTNVSNSRSLKRKVRLEFRFLNFQRNNFRILRNMFENERTTHKCLWIPTPDPDDQEVTARFAAYAKLTTIPSERHRYHGGDKDYVSFTIEVDESL